MSENQFENRVFVRIFAASLAIVSVIAVLYLLLGEQLVREYFEGSTFGGLLDPIDRRNRTWDEYAAASATRFWQNIVVGIPLSLLVLFGLYKLYKALLRQAPPKSAAELALAGESPIYWPIVAGIAYSVLTVIHFAPAMATFGAAMIGPPEDNMACLWTLTWASDHVFSGNGGLAYVNDLFYPEGSAFYYHAWSYYNLLLFHLLRPLFGAVASYNLLILHTFPFAGLAGYFFTRYFTKSHWLALLGGFLFAFNPAHFARAQHHMNIATIQFIPLFVLAFVKSIRSESRGAIAWAVLFLVLNALVDWNYLVYGLAFIILAYFYLAIRRRRIWLPAVAAKSCLVAAGALVVLSPLLVPMVSHAIAGGMAGAGGHNQYVIDIAALAVPPPLHLLGDNELVKRINASFTAWHWETTGYLGIVALALVALSLRGILNRVFALVPGMVSFLLLSFGAQPHFLGKFIPALTPGRIVPMLPLLSNSRAPSRNIVFVYLFWSVIVSFATGYAWKSVRKPVMRIALVGTLVALLVVDFFSVSRETTVVSVPPCYAALPRDGQRYGVLDLPSGYEAVARYMMYQSFHGLPIVQGWVSRRTNSALIDRLELADLRAQKRQLTEANVRFVVLHKPYLPSVDVDPVRYRQVYDQVFEDGQSIVLRVY